MRRWPIGLIVWLLLLAIGEAAVVAGLWHIFVGTIHGQLLDTVALDGNEIGHARINQAVNSILNAISLLSLLMATVVIGFIALIRRRVAVAFGAGLLLVGANATAQLLKYALPRPELGIDLVRASAGNSLPSGHTTIAASVAVALVLVLPAKARGAAALAGALFAGAAGVATLSAGWHRPSDAIAAVFVVGAWASIASVFIVLAQRRHGDVEYGQPHSFALALLVATGAVLAVGTGIAIWITEGVLDTTAPEDLSRNRLLVGYLGGAMGIAAAVCIVFALVLLTVHRVVPQVVPPELDSDDSDG